MPQNNTNEVRATAKYVRVAPRKARAVVSLIRNLPVEKALEVLQFSTRAASVDVAKVLRSTTTACARTRSSSSLPTLTRARRSSAFVRAPRAPLLASTSA